jgi:hypothetical protein
MGNGSVAVTGWYGDVGLAPSLKCIAIWALDEVGSIAKMQNEPRRPSGSARSDQYKMGLHILVSFCSVSSNSRLLEDVLAPSTSLHVPFSFMKMGITTG